MLHVLAFCNQLRRNLLVDALVSVSAKHPDLPMFGAPDWALATTVAAAAPAGSAVDADTPDGRVKPEAVVEEHMPAHRPAMLPGARQQVTPPSLNELKATSPGAEDALPAGWPRVGAGLYAQLAPEADDEAFMYDERDDVAFGHFFCDSFGRIVVPPPLDEPGIGAVLDVAAVA